VRRIAQFVVWSFLVRVPAIACSDVACISGGDEMRSGFAVRVTHDGKPLAGVGVEVVTQAGSEKLFSGVTDAEGTVYVTSLPSGEYWLNAEYFGVSAAYAYRCFHVQKDPSRHAKKRLGFNWGDYAPVTRRVVGKLIDSQPAEGGPVLSMIHRVDVPIRGATMKLKNPLTGAVYSATSDDNGEFNFPTLASGTYVLHLDGGKVKRGRGYDATSWVIDVSTKARSDSLLLTNREAAGGSCGGVSLDLRRSGN